MFNFFRSRHRQIATQVAALEKYDIKPALRQRLSAFFQEGDSRELYHANPRLIAERLQISEIETLRLLTVALKEGLVTLHWDLKCPGCGGIDCNMKKLGEMRTFHACSYCRHRHAVDADEQVRVTFSIDERLRKLNPKPDDIKFRSEVDAKYGVVSGHRLLTLQMFRDLFPRETIPPNESLIIRRVAILFTDLTGSTALYSRRGDSQAYTLVRQHFDILFRLVDQYQGAAIKTIGDAIMAAFTEPEQALQAAIAMHQEIARFNQTLQLPSEDQLILKIGIDVGPCISVTLNERLDYFGTTVNTAARVQATSQGQNIACTEAVLDDPKVAAIAQNYSSVRRNLSLKGLSTPLDILYLQITGNREQGSGNREQGTGNRNWD